jgi:hypothetical protein
MGHARTHYYFSLRSHSNSFWMSTFSRQNWIHSRMDVRDYFFLLSRDATVQ